MKRSERSKDISSVPDTNKERERKEEGFYRCPLQKLKIRGKQLIDALLTSYSYMLTNYFHVNNSVKKPL